jgi:hypothetical protein
MTVARSGHTATILSNGTVLIAGGQTCTSATSCTALSSAEIYDPVAGTFTGTSNGMSAARFGASAVALSSGLVIIAGGFDGTNLPAAIEIYTPGNGTFGWNGPNLNTPRFDATATLLNSGNVLIAGGSTCALPGCPTNAAEVYNAVSNTVSAVSGGMNVSRFNHSATLMTNGQVLIAGGDSSCASSCTVEASTEVFDPVAGSFTSSQAETTGLAGHSGTLLANGNVLLIGGINSTGITLAADEWYQPASLTPPALVSITVVPSTLTLMPGQTQQLVATGTFSDNSTQTMQSVIWSSSNPSAASVSNSPGSAGIVNGLSTGATTITATAGDIGGSASISAAALVSLQVNPTSASVPIGSGQQFTATGTFSDNSQQNLTSTATWSSSNNSTVLVGNTSGFQGFAMGAATGTATVTATIAGIYANTSVTVPSSSTNSAPNITSVSPTTGAAGTQVTVSGSNFGTSQGSGNVLLGSTYGAVVSWSNTQIVATVAAISQSGAAQVQQGGVLSNAVTFNVNTATVSNVSPTSGVPGTQVTVNGSGFGATQGSGQVWLGTANGAVQSWSDTQVVAIVANGSTSGNAQVLQGGVWSNSVPFAVNSLNVTGVTPNSGAPGTSITITGTGFGSSQGNGTVWLGSTNGQVMSWSNTQVVAVVAPSALTGIARVEQNGVWSNALSFTVPSGGGSALTIAPNLLNLVVGQTQNIQALNPSGQEVTGLTWTSSNPNVVSLSTDDPPILTALAAGHITITAGTASADVTVSSAALPTGTVIWSNPGDGSGVSSIVPAVPSASGVADVFAFQADGTVQAVTSSGTTAWTANLNGSYDNVPDFQGGLVVANVGANLPTITKLDGTTGQPYPAYTPTNQGDSLTLLAVHTDGTIFALDTNSAANTVSVVGINPTTGAQEFSVPLDQSVSSSSSSGTVTGLCPSSGLPPGSGNPTYTAPTFLSAMIAGDGYAYVAYEYQVATSVGQSTIVCSDDEVVQDSGTSTTNTVVHLMLLRVGTDGSSSKIDVKDWDPMYMEQCNFRQCSYANTGAVAQNVYVSMITNADQGTVLSWEADMPQYCGSGTIDPTVCNANVPAASTYGLASTVGGSLASSASNPTGIYPVLQAQDGTFLGGTNSNSMVAFDQSGNVMWSVPNDYPQIATADGGVIGGSGVTYDNQGRATGQVGALPTQSWTGNAYTDGPFQQVASLALNVADASFSPRTGANPSENSTALQRCAPLDSSTSAKLEGAYSALTSFLLGKYCPFCNAAIFQQVEIGTSQAEFTSYLQQGHEFCDGTKSQEPGGTIGASQSTVAAYFQASPTTTATTVATGPKTFPAKYPGLGFTVWTFSSTERKNLKTFFNPTLIPSDQPTNESLLFHESLHGFTGLGDGGVPGQIGLCDVIGPTPQTKIIKEYPECGSETVDITTWILNNIISPR